MTRSERVITLFCGSKCNSYEKYTQFVYTQNTKCQSQKKINLILVKAVLLLQYKNTPTYYCTFRRYKFQIKKNI